MVSQEGCCCPRTLTSLGISWCKAALTGGARGCHESGWLSPGRGLSWILQAQGDELQLALAQKSGLVGQLLAAQPVREPSVQIDPIQIELFWNQSFIEKGF